MKKASHVLLTIFAIGVILTLFAGGVSLLGYLAALVIGGETAMVMCVFIHKTYFPWVIRICSIAVGCGLLGMYFSKIKALTAAASSK